MVVFWILVCAALLLLAYKLLHTAGIAAVERTVVDDNRHGLHLFTRTDHHGGDDGPSSSSHHHLFIRLDDGKRFRHELAGDKFEEAWRDRRWRDTLEQLRARTGLDLAIDPAHASAGAAGAELAGHRIEVVATDSSHRYVCYRPDGSIAWRLRL